jgi:hypothetical protein
VVETRDLNGDNPRLVEALPFPMEAVRGCARSVTMGRKSTPSHFEMMNEDAVARDLKKIEARAYHISDWAEAIVRRYHALNLGAAEADGLLVRALYAWLLVPPTLWPFNIHNILVACLASVERSNRLAPRLRLLIELLPAPPADAICAGVADHEHHVQSGTYENLVNTSAKFRQNEETIRSDPQLGHDWTRLKATFPISSYQDAKGIIRRTMCVERNLRPSFSVNPRSARQLFAAAFDAFCLRWNLYGMEGDEPLLLKLAVNVTPYGTMIHIPAYWSFDPKRDIHWKVVAKLHRLRVTGRQGTALAESRAERRQDARKLPQLDKEVERLGLKGERKHSYLCAGLGWDERTSARRISRLRAEFKK